MIRKLFVVALLSVSAASGMAAERTALVVPSAKALIDLMFDVRDASRNHLEMISYSRNLDGSYRLYVFDQAQWRWRALALSSWRQGRCFRGNVRHVVFVGGDCVPDDLRGGRQWLAQVSELDRPTFAELLNALNEPLKFKKKHWNRFAVKYDLVLKDLNWQRRRYGSYGRSGEESLPAIEPEAGAETLSPEQEVIEESGQVGAEETLGTDGPVEVKREKGADSKLQPELEKEQVDEGSAITKPKS